MLILREHYFQPWSLFSWHNIRNVERNLRVKNTVLSLFSPPYVPRETNIWRNSRNVIFTLLHIGKSLGLFHPLRWPTLFLWSVFVSQDICFSPIRKEKKEEKKILAFGVQYLLFSLNIEWQLFHFDSSRRTLLFNLFLTLCFNLFLTVLPPIPGD